MPQHYSSQRRADSPHQLPDLETFYLTPDEAARVDADNHTTDEPTAPGWYYWPCFPGCLPDGDPIGPFDTEAAALDDARQNDDED